MASISACLDWHRVLRVSPGEGANHPTGLDRQGGFGIEAGHEISHLPPPVLLPVHLPEAMVLPPFCCFHSHRDLFRLSDTRTSNQRWWRPLARTALGRCSHENPDDPYDSTGWRSLDSSPALSPARRQRPLGSLQCPGSDSGARRLPQGNRSRLSLHG